MTSRLSAGLGRDAKVAGICEPNELVALAQPFCVRPLDAPRSVREFRIAWLHVRLVFHLLVFRGTSCDAGRDTRRSVASVAICAAQSHRATRVHRRLVDACMAAQATRALSVCFGLRLRQQRRPLRLRIRPMLQREQTRESRSDRRNGEAPPCPALRFVAALSHQSLRKLPPLFFVSRIAALELKPHVRKQRKHRLARVDVPQSRARHKQCRSPGDGDVFGERRTVFHSQARIDSDRMVNRCLK